MREQIITRDVIANPKSKYGDAKASTRHFITQRVTGAINLVFLLLLLYLVMQAVLNPCSAMPSVARSPAPPAPTTTTSNS